MSRWKNVLWISVAILALTLVVSQVAPSAVAQVRAALVRDVDNPALQPFRAVVEFSFTTLNAQRLITTVPAGKRLVIQHLSWTATNPTGQQIIFAGLRTTEFGQFVHHLQVNPPHVSAVSSLVLQDGATNVTVYFEPGEDVWLSVSKNSGGSASYHLDVHGYLISL